MSMVGLDWGRPVRLYMFSVIAASLDMSHLWIRMDRAIDRVLEAQSLLL